MRFIIVLIAIIYFNGCISPQNEVISPKSQISKPKPKQIVKKAYNAPVEPYYETTTTSTTQYYGCIAGGSSSITCQIKNAQRGLVDFNRRITELRRALGSCADCGNWY